MKKVKVNDKKKQDAETDLKRINLRAIRNKELNKPGGGLLNKSDNKNYKNAHAEFYGQSDDSEDERVRLFYSSQVVAKIGRLQSHKYKDKDFMGYDENLQKVEKKKAFGRLLFV